MRMIFSLLGLLIVVAIIGVLAKTQLKSVISLPVVPQISNQSTANPALVKPPANVAGQSQQMQTQVKDQVNDAMKAAAEAREKALESGNNDKNNDKAVDKTGSAY